MAYPNQIYFCPVKGIDFWNHTPPSSGYFDSTRAYRLDAYFKTKKENINATLKEMRNGSNVELSTNQNTNGNWHIIYDQNNLLTDSTITTPKWTKCFWKVKTSYTQVFGFGGGFNDSSEECYFHPGVIGATFSWSRQNCHWPEGECALKRWGLNYWNPDTSQWRTVEFNTDKDYTTDRDGNLLESHAYYRSNAGHEWMFHGKNPADLTGGKEGVYTSLGRATQVTDRIMTERWLWGGVWFDVRCTKRGSQSHTRSFDIANFQPIYDWNSVQYSSGSSKLIVQTVRRTQSDVKKNIYLN